MSHWFAGYAESPIGRELLEAIETPGRIFEFQALTEIGKPAVQAVARDVAPIIARLDSKSARDAASQFCGWYVGRIMRESGCEIVQDRGRVSDAPFKTGAVWQRRARKVQVVDGTPPPLTAAGRVELGVGRDEAGNVIARWSITMSARGLAHRVHEIRSAEIPIERAYRDALANAERLNVPVLWINDPQRLFPREKRLQVELQHSVGDNNNI
jgi:hypothetical protein